MKKKKKKEESDFVFMDRQSIIDSEHSTSTGSIDAYHQFTSSERSASSSVERFSSAERPSSSEKMKVFEYSSSPKKHHSGQHPLHQVITVSICLLLHFPFLYNSISTLFLCFYISIYYFFIVGSHSSRILVTAA